MGSERERLCRPHPDIEIIQETESPTDIPGHAYETPVFKIRKAVSKLEFQSRARIDDAIELYQVFRRLQDQGVLPRHLRFQVSVPFPSSALNGFKSDFAADYAVAGPAYEDLVRRELQRLMEAIPPSALAIQWDVCYEVQDIEGVIAWMGGDSWERFAGPVARLTHAITEEVLVGYHLCYGTFPHWPMYEARDTSLLVRMANFAIANSGRRVDWVHMAVRPTCAQRRRSILPPAHGTAIRGPACLSRHHAAARWSRRTQAALQHGVKVHQGFRRLSIADSAGSRARTDGKRCVNTAMS